MRKLLTAVSVVLASFGGAHALTTSTGEVSITAMASGLDEPWSMGFLPDGGVLITERDGALKLLRDGSLIDVRGVPRIRAGGQGGLMDVMIPRDFAESREVYLVYTAPQGRGEGTAGGFGTLSRDGRQLENFRQIFDIERGSSGGRHFGGRLVEASDGTLLLTVGDRGDRPSAQDTSNHNGSIVRITRTGGIPADNPFVGSAGQDAIWSYGHRNPQGAALDADGQLWVHEHGARGGDEVNLVKKGANYGWPVISYGRHYSGLSIGEGTAKPGMEQPALYWDPSIAPSGLAIYSGKLWPEWEGDLFVGSLKFDYIARVDDRSLTEVEQLSSRETGRVRDVREAPDGSIWFLSVNDGAAYRMAPGPSS
ncbi:MAG: PQQ-dependent sugar dehydrogenase [Pseudomonadota bacterium]